MSTKRITLSILAALLASVSCEKRSQKLALEEVELIQAAGLGNAAKVEERIRRGADVNYPDKMTKFTALIEATRFERTNVVPLLLRAGADPNLRERNGKTALIHAIVGGDKNTNLVKILLDAGANPAIGDKDGFTAFDYAKSSPPSTSDS